METQEIALAISAANFVLTWGVGIALHIANKDKATNGRISELQQDIDGKLDDHATRIARLETHAAESPTHRDLGQLYDKVNSLGAQVSAMGGKLESIDATLRLILSRITEKGMP